jgi:hypothetical protein
MLFPSMPACQLQKDRKYGLDTVKALMDELRLYRVHQPPFHKPCTIDGGHIATYWRTRPRDTTGAQVLSDPAILLDDVVPHAAAPERTFSTMGWMKDKGRNRLWS